MINKTWTAEGTISKVTLFLIMAVMSSVTAFAEPETVRFAPLPMMNRETVVKQFRPMTLFLEQKLGVVITYDYSESYQEMLEKFESGKVDLAYLGPLPYVELREKCEMAEPLVHFKEASGEPMYSCSIVALAESHLNLEGLKDRRFALTQPLSTCGYLSVNGLLKEHHTDLAHNRYRYLDKHDGVALAVVRGEFDAGGIKTAYGKKYAHMGLVIIAETPPLPGFALVAHRANMSPEKMDAIRGALLSLDAAGPDKERLSTWGENIRYGAALASDGDYDALRKLKGNIVIPTTDKN
jgi:phosphonate transport system substrate-binding protein